MEDQKEQPISRLQKWLVFGTWGLVFGTWVLVVTSIFHIWIFKNTMKDQLEEMQFRTELEWRPYLDIQQDLINRVPAWYLLGTSVDSANIDKDLSEISLNSKDFKLVQAVGYRLLRQITYKNNGKTPLRIRKSIVSSISEKEWNEDYAKSETRLVGRVQFERDTTDVDIVIAPGDSLRPTDLKGTIRRIPMKDFRDYALSDSLLILYPYVFVEYEDFFRRKRYNAFAMYYCGLRINITSDSIVSMEPDSLFGIGVERDRGDIQVETR